MDAAHLQLGSLLGVPGQRLHRPPMRVASIQSRTCADDVFAGYGSSSRPQLGTRRSHASAPQAIDLRVSTAPTARIACAGCRWPPSMSVLTEGANRLPLVMPTWSAHCVGIAPRRSASGLQYWPSRVPPPAQFAQSTPRCPPAWSSGKIGCHLRPKATDLHSLRGTRHERLQSRCAHICIRAGDFCAETWTPTNDAPKWFALQSGEAGSHQCRSR